MGQFKYSAGMLFNNKSPAAVCAAGLAGDWRFTARGLGGISRRATQQSARDSYAQSGEILSIVENAGRRG
jgi:hypothetical protein